MNKVLFLLHRDHDTIHDELSSTLYYASTFIHEMLNNNEIESKFELVTNAGLINTLVKIHNPTHVIIESLWATPVIFYPLCKIHPNIKWIGRIHCEIPHLAGVPNSLEYISKYHDFENVIIAPNSTRMLHDISVYLKSKNDSIDKIIHLPNFYPQTYKNKNINKNKEYIDISCFGAIRLLKNHMMQAISAIEFANQIGKKLRFHINAKRIEMEGDNAVNNLKILFEQLKDTGHVIVNHDWQSRDEFLELCSKMDIGMQVSITESFNIVAADLISQGVPIVGSIGEIPWAVPEFSALYSNGEDIIKKLHIAYNHSLENVQAHQTSLKSYTDETIKIWKEYFGKT